ncbi:hypothetical protein [Streptomyces sp. NPDC002067]
MTGPHRITVEPLPTGVTLDVEDFVRAVIADVVETLTDDDGYDALTEIRDTPAPHPTEPERLLTEELVQRLVDASATRIPVYGAQVAALAERLRLLTLPRPVPGQRSEGSAAA